MPENEPFVHLLTRVDSIASEVAHRYGSHLPDDVRRDLLAVSHECRALADRDALAVAVAQRWWPDRYVGDLTGIEWQTVYGVLDARRD